jgi:hypothetical protein
MVLVSPQAILMSRESADLRVAWWLFKGVPDERSSESDGAINGGLGQGTYTQWPCQRELQKARAGLPPTIDIFPPG